ncbi:MAG: hypothetical protein WDN48_11495 [Pseudolabrys sp.]
MKRFRRIDAIEARVEKIQESLGRIEARQIAAEKPASLRDAEFRVFSQWGEDGIIQYLVQRVPVGRKIFVEFGVEHYAEANTRFLLVNDNWSGFVIDGSEANVRRIRAEPIYWRHNLKAECAFVTRENINALLSDHGISGDIGILSIDIDGNDYWVWEAIEVVDPRIVIVEYNARFGAERAVTVPYDPNFIRSSQLGAMTYYGASLAGLEKLGKRKGYSLVGCNAAGNNAFFVRTDCLVDDVKPVTAAQAFVAAKFREARDVQGDLLFLSPDDEIALIESLPLIEVAD